MKKKLTRIALRVGLGLLGVTGLIGFAHTKAGRPLLNALRGAPGCPVNLDGASPAEVETYRAGRVRLEQGTGTAASHYALGFELGKTTRQQVVAWTESQHIACKGIRKDSVLSCSEVPTDPVDPTAPKIEDLHLQFDANDHLVAIDLFRVGVASAPAIEYLKSLEKHLDAAVGPPTNHLGIANAAPSDLSHQFQMSGAEYHYKGYVAEVSAMNFGKRAGVRVREQYQWAPATPPA